jgi:hypothetical protein
MIGSVTLADDQNIYISAVLYSHSDNLFVSDSFLSYIINKRNIIFRLLFIILMFMYIMLQRKQVTE